MAKKLYHTMVRIQGEPVMGAHVLAETPQEARAYIEKQFFMPPADELPAHFRKHQNDLQQMAVTRGWQTKVTKSSAPLSNAINA